MEIKPGEAWVGVSSGGGGFGDPLEREATLVCKHVRDGIISLETAKDVYGVIMSSDTYELEDKATKDLRAERTNSREPLKDLQPTRPNAGTWAQENMKKGEQFLLDPLP